MLEAFGYDLKVISFFCFYVAQIYSCCCSVSPSLASAGTVIMDATIAVASKALIILFFSKILLFFIT